jgi:hypothetical protein
VRHGNLDQLELAELGFGLERDGFLAIGRVVVQVDDLLAGQRSAVLVARYLTMADTCIW